MCCEGSSSFTPWPQLVEKMEKKKKEKRLKGEILKADQKWRKCTSPHIFGCTAKALYVNKSKRIK